MTYIVAEHPDIIAGVAREPGAVDELVAALEREQARADHLKTSVQAARRIGMAVGLLMGSYQLTEDEAFAALERTSHANGRKLHDTAEEVLRTRSLDVQI
jgi:AmiR/NasT family two-component response regulator